VTADRAKQRLGADVTIVVLNDPDAPGVVEVLSRHTDSRVIAAGRAFGTNCPDGCEWVTAADLKFVDQNQAADEEDARSKLVLAAFHTTPGGKQLELVTLPEREVLLAVTVPGTTRRLEVVTPFGREVFQGAAPLRKSGLTADQYVTEADEYLRMGKEKWPQAELALRKALAVAADNAERGRVERCIAALRFAQGRTDAVDAPLRVAQVYLPTGEWKELPEKVRDDLKPLPGFREVEKDMTRRVKP